LADVRRSVWNLGPAALEAGNLVEALQGETDRRRAGLPCRLLVSGSARPLTPETQLAALRVAQEAIANSRKHAAASSVEIELTFGDERAILAVADDGRGFDPATALAAPPTPHGGMGLRGMAERVRRAGGEMEIVSAPGQGARIVVQLPYAPIASPPDARLDEPVRRSPTGRIWRAIVIDDHPAARAGLRALLAGEPDIDVVGEAGDGEAGLRLAAELRPDIALVDLRLPKLGGIELIARLDRLESATRTLVVTSFGQDELVLQALRAGARGYLLKDAGGAELAAAVRAVAAGGSFLGPVVAAKLTGGLTRPERLTPREREVLGLLGRGLTDKEIAAELGASAKTANFHVANVLAKLNANNRTDAVRIAYERGLLGS
jgi:DNA-binding NarL/FixJ family response regulator/anti-sigma regulatory factor (Ser/Thr protein kinase)